MLNTRNFRINKYFHGLTINSMILVIILKFLNVSKCIFLNKLWNKVYLNVRLFNPKQFT